MDFATNSIQVTTLSVEQAAEYARHNYDHNRKPRPAHVDYLVNEMRNGRFMSTAEVHIMYRNGEPVLINGQHTCAAIVKYGKPVRVTIRKTIAAEAGQVAMMYAFGHDTGLSRTFSDSMRAYDIAEATGLSSTQVNSLAAALRYILEGFSATYYHKKIKMSPADLVNDVYAWAPEMKLLQITTANTDGKISRALQKRSVLSVAILTLFFKPEKAIEFWKGIVDPDRLPSKDIRVTCRRILLDSLGSSLASKETDRLTRLMSRGWNSFYKDDGLLQLKVMDHTAPMILEGTPYNGKQPQNYLPSRLDSPLAIP